MNPRGSQAFHFLPIGDPVGLAREKERYTAVCKFLGDAARAVPRSWQTPILRTAHAGTFHLSQSSERDRLSRDTRGPLRAVNSNWL